MKEKSNLKNIWLVFLAVGAILGFFVDLGTALSWLMNNNFQIRFQIYPNQNLISRTISFLIDQKIITLAIYLISLILFVILLKYFPVKDNLLFDVRIAKKHNLLSLQDLIIIHVQILLIMLNINLLFSIPNQIVGYFIVSWIFGIVTIFIVNHQKESKVYISEFLSTSYRVLLIPSILIGLIDNGFFQTNFFLSLAIILSACLLLGQFLFFILWFGIQLLLQRYII